MAESYTTIINYVETTLTAVGTYDHISKGGSLDDAINSDTGGHVHLEEPADPQEWISGYTGGDYLAYHVDAHYIVAGDEAWTASQARAFADQLKTSFLHKKNKIAGFVHSDTNIEFGTDKDNEWDAGTAQRHVRHRLSFLMSEDY